ncbi:MAG: HNH endonuclease [Kofleriaceae bacterium]
MTGKRRRVLAIVATDRTFEPSRHGTARVWVGACIHCRSPLTVGDDGTPISQATIEHIWPQRHGGDNQLLNLALACGQCNRQKGARHDTRSRTDPRLLEITAALKARRQERWREPPPELAGHVAWAAANTD